MDQRMVSPLDDAVYFFWLFVNVKYYYTCGIASKNYHALLHMFATRCIESGMDVKSLSEILGYANAAITLNICSFFHGAQTMHKWNGRLNFSMDSRISYLNNNLPTQLMM